MLHDDNIEHTGLVVETQAMLSNDASRPRGIIGTICYDKEPSIQRANQIASSFGNDRA